MRMWARWATVLLSIGGLSVGLSACGSDSSSDSTGSQAAVVKKELFTLFKCRFTVDVPGPDDLEAQGDFLDHEYEFMRDGHTVASVSKRWFSITDTYGVDIADGEDPVLILASAVVVDMACHPDEKR